MPLPLIPLLIGGAALLSGGVAVKKGLDAKEDFERAERITENAKKIYDKAQAQLENQREATQENLEALGKLKCEIYDDYLKKYVVTFEKIKNIEFDCKLIDSSLVIDKKEFASIRDVALKMSDVLASATASLTGGALAGIGAFGGAGLLATASTGTAISALSGVAATNATLAWFGGGALAAGGLGMAGGTIVLGGIVAAPVLLVGGFIMAAKAEAAVSDAYSNLEKAEAAAEAMKSARSAARAINRRVEEMQDILEQLLLPFEDKLEDLIDLTNDEVDYQQYSNRERKIVGESFALAKTIKNILETPIFDDTGEVTEASKQIIRSARNTLDELAGM